MSGDRSLAESFAELTQFYLGDTTLLSTLTRIADLAVDAIDAADFAGVTMLIDGEVRTGVFTDPDATEIDQAQYDSGSGPCLDSFRTGEIFRIGSTADEGRWPEFRKVCRAHGINSTASFPMLVDDAPHGAMNFYSRRENAFGATEIRLGRQFAAQAGVVVAYARSYWNARELSEQLERALVSRAEIEQAKGIIMATTGVDADAAFETLVNQSQHENRKLRDVAVELIRLKVRKST